jgi:hypothetical protein
MRLRPSRIVLIASTLAFLGIAVWWNLTVRSEQQFSFLAQSFRQGELAFLDRPGSWADATPYEGRYYWPLGPLPAIVLMPFGSVADSLGYFFYQGWLQPFLVIAVLSLVYVAARRVGHTRDDAGWLAFGFCFSTAFLGVAVWPWSWYFSQVLTCAILFAAIVEMAGRRRPWLLGSLFALALATRVTAAIGILWPAGAILSSSAPLRRKLASLVALSLPCVAVLGLLLLYNHARFGDAFEQGYAAQLIPSHAAAARAYGTFGLIHLPGNLYHLLLSAPLPVRRDQTSFVLGFPFVAANPWGMSVFVTSPCFFLLFGLRHRDATSRLLLLTVLTIAIPIVLYYGVGFRQFGYRYALDFLPFLYFLLLRNLWLERGGLADGVKALLLLSALFNLWLFAGHFVPGFAP